MDVTRGGKGGVEVDGQTRKMKGYVKGLLPLCEGFEANFLMLYNSCMYIYIYIQYAVSYRI